MQVGGEGVVDVEDAAGQRQLVFKAKRVPISPLRRWTDPGYVQMGEEEAPDGGGGRGLALLELQMAAVVEGRVVEVGSESEVRMRVEARCLEKVGAGGCRWDDSAVGRGVTGSVRKWSAMLAT